MFSKCTSLKDVFCYIENVPTTSLDAFDETNIEDATLHVLENSVDDYKNSEPWSKFGNIIAFADSKVNGVVFNKRDDAIYTIDGKRHKTREKGINIVRTSDGTFIKVYQK